MTDTLPRSTSEQCFEKALKAENEGDNVKAERWLQLAVNREKEELAEANA